MSDHCFEKIEELLKKGFLYAGFNENPSGQAQLLFFKPTEDKKEKKK